MSPSRFARQPAWRRRLITGLTAYVVLLAALGGLGLGPSPALFAAFFAAAGSALVYLADRMGDSQAETWPTRGPSTTGLGRGADHRAPALARRLAGVARAPEGTRANLAQDLHAQLSAVVADRVQHLHGRDLLTDLTASRELLPPDLAEFVLGPPDERRLTDPAALTHLLDRIESL